MGQFTPIFNPLIVGAVPCPRCKMPAGAACRNLNRKVTKFEEDGVKKLSYRALKNGAIHKEREKHYDKVRDEQKQREKSEGVTAKERREMEELRAQIKADQEAHGIKRGVLV